MNEVLKAKDDEILKLFKMCNEKDQEIERLNKRIENLNIINEEHKILNEMIRKELQQKESIIKEVREYITSYESISIMQGLMKEYSNYDLDVKTMNEMIRRYMIVHDELLNILDKGDE